MFLNEYIFKIFIHAFVTILMNDQRIFNPMGQNYFQLNYVELTIFYDHCPLFPVLSFYQKTFFEKPK
jgi:hypothetical protein